MNKAQPLCSNKFLVPKAFTFQDFQFNIRKKLKLSKSSSLCLTVNEKTIPVLDASIVSVYKENKDSDGFLYIKYSIEEYYG